MWSSLHAWAKETKQSILVDADGKLVKKKTEKMCIKKKKKKRQKKYVVFIEYRLVWHKVTIICVVHNDGRLE